jgi:hypothetical protein
MIATVIDVSTDDTIAHIEGVPSAGQWIEVQRNGPDGQTFESYRVVRVMWRALAIGAETPLNRSGPFVFVRRDNEALFPIDIGWSGKLVHRLARLILTWVRNTPKDSRDIMVHSLVMDILRAVQKALDEKK